MTLEEIVRKQIGEEGPQLSPTEYEERIDEALRSMPAGELLARISDALEQALEEAGVL